MTLDKRIEKFEKSNIGLVRDNKVRLLEHSANWKSLFHDEADLISNTLNIDSLELHHCGSTSIPNILAKPIIDIVGVLDSLEELDNKKELLENLGYEYKGEYGIKKRRYSVLYNSDKTKGYCHLHIFLKNSLEFENHILFKNYLIENRQAAIKYENLKKSLDVPRTEYSDAKSELILELLNESKLITILKDSPLFMRIFKNTEFINLNDWYIAGGAITQTVWNHLLNKDPLHGIKDIDLVFYNKNSSLENDKALQDSINRKFKDLGYHFDVQNEANVHLWYEKRFGNKISQYKSTEDGISTWLSAFSVGVRKDERFLVFAAKGLDDLFSMTVRPNKKQITEEIYNKMAARLLADWPEINVIPWGNSKA